MADLRPPEPGTNGASAVVVAALPAVEAAKAAAAAAAACGAQPPAPPYSKRRRRPSVRLGDIDAPPPRRNHKPSSSSHSRPPRRPHPDDPDTHGGRGPKPPAQRRPRTAWIPAGPAEGCYDEEERYYDDEDQSDSAAAAAAAAAMARVSGSRDAGGDESDGVADWGLPNGRLSSAMGHGRVKVWLDGLGLSRYAPVFEIHEVDGEVLPLLTLEDLKDMGIGAVGSRRKMYAAILKLRSDNAS
uniref:SAM domain family protein n=1 Tax=Zea mays TaxID=4577 RepID=B6SUI3_MAIZE|nr:SAM domain family protein [Zea mays]|eukprot:NP_001147733.1 SAM domain family protein [Zea mays]